MTPNELKNTIGVTKTIQMVGDALGFNYHPDCAASYECCRNKEPKESDKYIVFWYNPDSDGFRLRIGGTVYYVGWVEVDSIIDYVKSVMRFNKALKTSYIDKEIAKDF